VILNPSSHQNFNNFLNGTLSLTFSKSFIVLNLKNSGLTYLIKFNFCINIPPRTLITIPIKLYIIVVCIPNIAGKSINEASLINGDAIRKVKVTPNGIPAPKNPINNGIEEHEQNGVIIPRIAASK
jgi:hypothetical protein